MDRLKVLLRVAWAGSAPWSVGGDSELNFWLATDFSALRSRMRHDAVKNDVASWVARPDGSMASDIRVFAADTSETGSGGGEFVRDGHVWRLLEGTGIYIRLSDKEIGTSSCFRECKGVDRLDLTLIPEEVARAVVVCDAQAAISVLENGSSVPELQEVAVSVFKRQLRHGRILFFAWASRNQDIIELSDDRSRLLDNHAFQTAPAVFWEANAIAEELWGQGFQVDMMADMHNVMPPSCSFKLPFFSRWLGPHTSGVDAMAQAWTGRVAWVNPPFALVERIICLLRSQRAVAAVVVPLAARTRWSPWACEGAEGVARVWSFDPRRPEFSMRGRTAPQTYKSGYAVVFFDFRSAREAKRPWSSSEGAGVMRRRHERVLAARASGDVATLAVTYAERGVAGGGASVCH